MSTKPRGRTRTRPAAVPPSLIAERAYFKAEQRGFAPGCDLDDWLAAERELAAEPAAKRTRKPRRASD